ncbi:hypothetical protein CONPUDRAFT_151150 [Coniophora puteana RWD-64-598 SS2]|uniref:Uncharacterized protein n=1 Tax=Coniophora puteana (strain RWD-64-598) TaxID=741705 RepID=A0A5M3MYH7_CONPW|nr:uncharacterized protein CONPUDRAFT_151150 [Coniophora puteana RWD-64-598 SS2]EIW84106.1 hypothetical protein CONPUDRAFT_151150 [Coniophora puteana RWD-64-598 SS2]
MEGSRLVRAANASLHSNVAPTEADKEVWVPGPVLEHANPSGVQCYCEKAKIAVSETVRKRTVDIPPWHTDVLSYTPASLHEMVHEAIMHEPGPSSDFLMSVTTHACSAASSPGIDNDGSEDDVDSNEDEISDGDNNNNVEDLGLPNDERTMAAGSAGEDDVRGEADMAEAMDNVAEAMVVVSEDEAPGPATAPRREVIEVSSDEEGPSAREMHWRGVIDLTEDDSD